MNAITLLSIFFLYFMLAAISCSKDSYYGYLPSGMLSEFWQLGANVLRCLWDFTFILAGCFVNRDDAFSMSLLLTKHLVNVFLKQLKVSD